MAQPESPAPTEPTAPTRLADPFAEMARRDQARANAPAEAPPAPAVSTDPVTRGMTWASEQLPAGTPDWLRTAGRFLLPQTTPEAVATALTLPLGGVGGLAAKAGIPLVSKLAAKGVLPFLARTGLTGAATGAAGAATGHDLASSALTGVGARVLGEPAGALAKKGVEHAVSNRLLGNVTDRVTTGFRQVIGPWLPKGATNQQVIQSIVADEPSQKVGRAIGALRKELGDTPVNVMDLQPLLSQQGVVYGLSGAAKEGAPGTAAAVKDLGMVWPPVREFGEKAVTAGTEMVPFGSVAKPGGAAGAKAIGPGGELARSGGMVPWGEVDTAIEAAQKAIGPVTTPEAHQHYHALEQLRGRVAARVGNAELTQLLQEYGRTKALRDWLWGSRGATAAYGERVVDNLVDKAGNLSPAGFNDLMKRFMADAPKIARSLGPEHVSTLATALGWDRARGLAHPVVGEGAKALIPAAVAAATGAGRHWVPHEVARQTPRVFSHVPGWESARSLAQKAYPALTRGVTAPAVGKAQEETYGTEAK